MRKSLLRLANRGHHEILRRYGKQLEQANSRLYMKLNGLERVAFMRHYLVWSKGVD